MKVAHLDTGRDWRGGQNQVLLLMRGLKARGHEVLLLAPCAPLAERARAEGLQSREWSPRGEVDLPAMLAAARALREFGPRMVHAHSAHAHAVGVPAARLARVPGVVVSRRVDFRVGGNPLSRIKYKFGVDRYLCISRGVVQAMEASGITPGRLTLVPSGIEIEDAPGAGGEVVNLREWIGVARDTPIVGTVAALAPHKNHSELLRAAAGVLRALPGVHFVWLGEGPCRPALERERARLGLEGRVHLLGFRTDAQSLMAQFTVFALASYLEGLCTSLLDAQRAGVPVIATAVGGIPDVIRDGVSGRLVWGRDPDAMVRALIEALEQPELRAAWRRSALESVREFSASAMVQRTLEAYESVFGGEDSAP